MHNLKVSDIQRGEGLGLVKDSVQLTEMERILQRFDAPGQSSGQGNDCNEAWDKQACAKSKAQVSYIYYLNVIVAFIQGRAVCVSI